MIQPRTQDIQALVVDDSDFFAEMTAETLTNNHGITTSFETSGEDALGAIGEMDVDCIISDYQMPGMNGLEFLEQVKDQYGDIPFILLTGRGDEEIASEAIASGASDYLLKLEVVEDQQYERLAKRVRNVVTQAQTHRMYQRLVDNSPDVIAHVDLDGTILGANPAMADLLGLSREELSGQTLEAVFPHDVGRKRLDAGRKAIEHGTSERTEDKCYGSYFHNIFVPAQGTSSKVSFQMISRDITERKEREQALERQNERLDRFASVISHDLQNPLNVAKSSAEAMEAEGEIPDRLRRALDRMESLIEEVLELARQGELVAKPSPVSLSKPATEAWSYVDAADATLEIETDAVVLADSDRLQQLFGNLFQNAIDHALPEDADRALTISVGTLGEGFYVEDNGQGIPAEQHDQIFEPGYTSTRDGTGFGLSIVREIAQAHGWSLSLAGDSADGARFEITGVEFE